MSNHGHSQSASPLAIPPRPKRPLSTIEIIRTRGTNSLALLDEELFDVPFAERRFLWYRFFVVSDPGGVQRILADNFQNYHRHPLMRRPLAAGLRSAMLMNDGLVWRRHRNLINPLFGYRAVLPDVPMLVTCTELLAEHLSNLPPSEDINIGHFLSMLISGSIARVFAGSDEVEAMVVTMAKFPGERRLSDFVPLPSALRLSTRRLRREVEAWYPLVDRLLAERCRADYAGDRDFVWRLAHATGKDGDRLSDAELRDEVLTLAMGGIQTTLRAMTWVWYLLAMHPWAEDRLHGELARVLGGRLPTPADLPHLPYMRQIIDETMRLYPPIPVMVRTAIAEDEVCGRHIPRGASVMVAPWIIHRHRRLWPEPDRFDPERFSPARSTAQPRFAFLPFAAGPRACVAAPLATMQIYVAVALLAQRFRFRLAPGHPVVPVGWTTLRPDGGIWMRVERR